MAEKDDVSQSKNLGEELGLNEKQMQFCEYYVKNGNAGLSYKKAYSDNTGKELTQGSCYSNGSKLLKKEKIQNYIAHLRQEEKSVRIMEKEDIITSLQEIATDYASRTSDKIRALELLGKFYSMWSDNLNVSSDTLVEINLTGELEQEDTGEIIEQNVEKIEGKKASNE